LYWLILLVLRERVIALLSLILVLILILEAVLFWRSAPLIRILVHILIHIVVHNLIHIIHIICLFTERVGLVLVGIKSAPSSSSSSSTNTAVTELTRIAEFTITAHEVRAYLLLLSSSPPTCSTTTLMTSTTTSTVAELASIAECAGAVQEVRADLSSPSPTPITSLVLVLVIAATRMAACSPSIVLSSSTCGKWVIIAIILKHFKGRATIDASYRQTAKIE